MRARRGLIVLCLVPGLPLLFFGRERLGLVLAASFTVLLNAALVLSLVWNANAPESLEAGLWMGVAASWAASAAASWRWMRRRLHGRPPADADALYREALEHYLKRDWQVAESLWEWIVEDQPADADAHLALATLHARLRRIEPARLALRRARQADHARKWSWEIEQTAAWLDEQAAVVAAEADDAPEHPVHGAHRPPGPRAKRVAQPTQASGAAYGS